MKRQSNIRRLCHQALAATLITGSLMGTGLLGSKVVYGDVSEDADSIQKTLTSGGKLEESLKKVTNPKTLFGLFAILTSDFNLDNESSTLVSTKLSALLNYFNTSKANNSPNRKAVIEEIKRRVLELEKAQEAEKKAEEALKTEKLERQSLNRELEGTRKALKLVIENSHKLEQQLATEQQKVQQVQDKAKKAQEEASQAEETAQQAKSEKEKAENEAKNAREEANAARLDSQRAQEESNKLRGEAEKAKQEAEKSKKDLEIQK
ncbi:TPA: cell surface protein, partial [Streptococcus equi subsp. zooepidemicus]|nr:cell surface protein [Streptococcus equi subsp. zooepidemicus]